MKYMLVTLLLLFAVPALGQNLYQHFFTSGALRIDYYHSGTKSTESIVPDELFQESVWPGSRTHLIDTLNLGMYLVKVTDVASNRLIYSYGFSTLFNEWQTTEEAGNGQSRVISETVRIPFPRNPVLVEFYRRDKQNHFTRRIGDMVIRPDSWQIRKENRAAGTAVFSLMQNGDPGDKVDLVVVGEGYTAKELEKFQKDAQRLTDRLFSTEPFKKHRTDFNVTAVIRPSAETGTDDPRKHIYKNTALNSSFNTFGSQRYLMSFDNKDLRDIASAVPYDALYILVNTDIYGGGGIYNLYACCSSDNRWSGYVFVHEFGHSFAGLGDEYYTSDVAYSDFYPKGVEPWEPNVTALLDPRNIKWKKYVTPDTPIPTPWKKDVYDKRERQYRKQLSEMRRSGAPDAEINKLIRQQEDWLAAFFRTNPARGKVGAFEGAGYASSGLYRPALNCIMFSKGDIPFDPVCAAAIDRRIRFLIH